MGSKDFNILKFETELYVAHKRGFVFRYVHLTEFEGLGEHPKIAGVEILFSDEVSLKQVSQIQDYITKTYGFEIDDTLCEDINILIVRY